MTLITLPAKIHFLTDAVGSANFFTHKKSSKEINTFIRKQAEEILRILRRSTKSLRDAFAEAPGMFIRLYSDQRLLAAKTKAVKDGGGFKRKLWFKSSTERALDNLNHYLLAHLPVRNPKYDMQIQLKLCDVISAGQLSEKAAHNFLENHTIDSQSSVSDMTLLRHLTHSSRLYITGHGSKNSNRVLYRTDGGKEHTVDDIVNLLLKYAPQLKTKSQEGRRIKISLIVCHAAEGAGDTHDGSFALALSQALDAAGIEAEVIGRKGEVWMFPEEGSKIKKMANNGHQLPNTTFSFVTSGGVTTIKDRYA